MISVQGPNAHYDPLARTYINELPADVLTLIFANVDLDSQISLPQVCTRWKNRYFEAVTIKFLLATFDPTYTSSTTISELFFRLRLRNLKRTKDLLGTIPRTDRIYASQARIIAGVYTRLNQTLVLHTNSDVAFLNSAYQPEGNLVFNRAKISALHNCKNLLYLSTIEGVIYLSKPEQPNQYAKLYTSPINAPINQLKVHGNLIFFTHTDDTSVRRYDQTTGKVHPAIGVGETPISAFEIGVNRLFISHTSENPNVPSQVQEWDLKDEQPKLRKTLQIATSSQRKIAALCSFESYLFVGEHNPKGNSDLHMYNFLTGERVWSKSFELPIVGMFYDYSKLFVASTVSCSVLTFPVEKKKGTPAALPPPDFLPPAPMPPQTLPGLQAQIPPPQNVLARLGNRVKKLVSKSPPKP